MLKMAPPMSTATPNTYHLFTDYLWKEEKEGGREERKEEGHEA